MRKYILNHAGTSEGARLNGEGIGDILPRSSVLGLEDEATVSGVHAVYVARSLRRMPLQHRAEWAGDFFDAGRGVSIREAFLNCYRLHWTIFIFSENSRITL